MACIFCTIVVRQLPAEIVFEDEATLAFMDINFHVHLFPRWFGDDARWLWTPAPGRPEEIRQAAQQIRAHIEH